MSASDPAIESDTRGGDDARRTGGPTDHLGDSMTDGTEQWSTEKSWPGKSFPFDALDTLNEVLPDDLRYRETRGEYNRFVDLERKREADTDRNGGEGQ